MVGLGLGFGGGGGGYCGKAGAEGEEKGWWKV